MVQLKKESSSGSSDFLVAMYSKYACIAAMLLTFSRVADESVVDLTGLGGVGKDACRRGAETSLVRPFPNRVAA